MAPPAHTNLGQPASRAYCTGRGDASLACTEGLHQWGATPSEDASGQTGLTSRLGKKGEPPTAHTHTQGVHLSGERHALCAHRASFLFR